MWLGYNFGRNAGTGVSPWHFSQDNNTETCKTSITSVKKKACWIPRPSSERCEKPLCDMVSERKRGVGWKTTERWWVSDDHKAQRNLRSQIPYHSQAAGTDPFTILPSHSQPNVPLVNWGDEMLLKTEYDSCQKTFHDNNINNEIKSSRHLHYMWALLVNNTESQMFLKQFFLQQYTMSHI